MDNNSTVVDNLKIKFGEDQFAEQKTHDDFPTLWVSSDKIVDILSYLKNEIDKPYKMLYDLTAIDERARAKKDSQPDTDFTVVYHLLSFD
ncbi:MAG: NADH-quinone oxidoreductase subunit C, partial [Ignavibacteriaceae bacterium]